MPEVGFESALGASYRLLEVVGRGATGEVWRAVDHRTDEPVAAKLLRAEHVADRDLVGRFVQERSVLTGLRHPNLVSVRDLVVEGDRLAIVMDYVAGGTLRGVLDERGPLPPHLAAALVAEVLDGLAAAHDRRLVHRDIKPDNVLLAERWAELEPGGVRLTDFGIARIVGDGPTTTTGLLGTPEYMSPELLTAGEAGPPADVYGVGILLYELLAGRTPYAGPGTDYTVAHRHVSSAPPPLPVPEELWTLLSGMLDKDPRSRPNAAAAADALRGVLPALADAPALERQASPEDFASARGPVTVVRGLTPDTAPEEPVTSDDAVPEPAPDLGTPGSVTVVRPMARVPVATPVRPASETDDEAATPWWRQPRVLAAVAGSLVLVAVVAFVVVRGHRSSSTGASAASQSVQATQQDQPLPTGLTVSRSATYDPSARTVDLTLTFAAQNAALRGPFFEVVGGLPGDDCPAVTWQGAVQSRNLPSVTGVDADCSWSLDPGPVPRQGSVTLTAQVGLRLGSKDPQSTLQDWLNADAAATTKAVEDPQVSSTSYVAQRLQSIEIDAPAQTVSGATLPITVLPVWPKGRDELNPLYRSPSTGPASGLLRQIAGGGQGLRFSDGCNGALAVTSDGLVVTALRVADQCTVDAIVGNFANLESNEFAIVSRGG